MKQITAVIEQTRNLQLKIIWIIRLICFFTLDRSDHQSIWMILSKKGPRAVNCIVLYIHLKKIRYYDKINKLFSDYKAYLYYQFLMKLSQSVISLLLGGVFVPENVLVVFVWPGNCLCNIYIFKNIYIYIYIVCRF